MKHAKQFERGSKVKATLFFSVMILALIRFADSSSSPHPFRSGKREVTKFP